MRELRLFALGYGISLGLIVITGALLSTSKTVPLWKRILTLEDAGCAYGSCFILAGLAYAGFRAIVGVADARRSGRTSRFGR